MMNLLGQALQPQAPQPQGPQVIKAPPSGPEELEQRKAGWASFFQRPEVQAALLQMGMALGRPIPYGQSAGGHIVQAMGQGAMAAGRYQNMEQQRQVEEEERRLEQANTERELGMEERRLGQYDRQIAQDQSQFEASHALDEARLEFEKAYREAELEIERAREARLGRGAGAGTPTPEEIATAAYNQTLEQYATYGEPMPDKEFYTDAESYNQAYTDWARKARAAAQRAYDIAYRKAGGTPTAGAPEAGAGTEPGFDASIASRAGAPTGGGPAAPTKPSGPTQRGGITPEKAARDFISRMGKVQVQHLDPEQRAGVLQEAISLQRQVPPNSETARGLATVIRKIQDAGVRKPKQAPRPKTQDNPNVGVTRG